MTANYIPNYDRSSPTYQRRGYDSEQRRLAALKSAAVRHGEDTAEIEGAIYVRRCELEIVRLLKDAPPLSTEQRERIGALFSGAMTIAGLRG